jgi:hypothetical protein
MLCGHLLLDLLANQSATNCKLASDDCCALLPDAIRFCRLPLLSGIRYL